MKKGQQKGTQRVNWPVTILLILGSLTIFFPLYMAVVIAFKSPSEMTNDIAGILSLPSAFRLDRGHAGNRFLAFPGKQPPHYLYGHPYSRGGPFPGRIRHRAEYGPQPFL